MTIPAPPGEPLTVPIASKPWKSNRLPRRILAIRLQAMGDVMITLPYLQYLRSILPPEVEIDFLTRDETASLPGQLVLFNKVYVIKGWRNVKKQVFYTGLLLPRLLLRRYEMVIDLQNNIISETVRRVLMPKAWSVFERFAPLAAGERTKLTIEAVGLGAIQLLPSLRLKNPGQGTILLHQQGWNGIDPLVILNPAAAFITRNWPLQNYVEFARGWLLLYPATKFLLVGTPFIAEKAAYLKEQLGGHIIDTIGFTTPALAFEIIQEATLVLSEDSGLMHMSWVSGIPTMVLFGGTRSDHARPLGAHTAFLDAADLSCGGCMQATCQWSDVRCMTRYTPAMVIDACRALLEKQQPLSPDIDQAGIKNT